MVNMTKDYIESLMSHGAREDHRGFLDYRQPITIEYHVSSNSAEGSARVKIGDTEVVAGIKLGVGTPYPDTPDQGALMVDVELIPLSNPEFESGPPSIDAVELARVIDRGIRESHVIDMSKLCIKKGEKVWMVFVDIYPLNDDGNLFDAGFLAAMAALKTAVFPTFDAKTGLLDYATKTTKKLPLTCLPMEVTVYKIKDKLLIDPTLNESKSYDARLTVASLDDTTLCAMQKGGPAPLTAEETLQMIDIALEKARYLRGLLK